MSRRRKDSLSAVDYAGQDGACSMHLAKEAAVRLFTKPGTKDMPPMIDPLPADGGDQESSEAPDGAWLDDPAAPYGTQ